MQTGLRTSVIHAHIGLHVSVSWVGLGWVNDWCEQLSGSSLHLSRDVHWEKKLMCKTRWGFAIRLFLQVAGEHVPFEDFLIACRCKFLSFVCWPAKIATWNIRFLESTKMAHFPLIRYPPLIVLLSQWQRKPELNHKSWISHPKSAAEFRMVFFFFFLAFLCRQVFQKDIH